jgi:hypothetical protein
MSAPVLRTDSLMKTVCEAPSRMSLNLGADAHDVERGVAGLELAGFVHRERNVWRKRDYSSGMISRSVKI